MDNDTKAIIKDEIVKSSKEYFDQNPVPFHNHNGVNSLKLKPEEALFGFPCYLVTDATVAPTDNPQNGTIRFHYDTTNTVMWYRVNNVWVSNSSGLVPVVSNLQYYSTLYDAGNGGSSKTIDWDNGNVQKVTLDSGTTTTFTFTNGKAGARYLLQLKQDATGSRTCAFPASVKWAGGITPTLTTTASYTDIVTFFCDGTNYAGNFTLNFNM